MEIKNALKIANEKKWERIRASVKFGQHGG